MKRILATTFALSMIAAVAAAQHGGGMDSRSGFGPDQRMIVASDGTVFIADMMVDTATRTVTTTVKAVSPAGTILWTGTVSNARGPLLLSGSNLIFAKESTASDGAVSTTLTAISAATGSTAWSQTLTGRATSLEPFSAGTYAIVVTPASTTGGTASRSLVAVGNNGAILWTISLS